MQLVRLALLGLTALTLAHPASAQFGGLKKKLKKSTNQADTTTSAPAADPTPDQGGSVVLTADVVSKLITGLKAGQTEREAAGKEDTPYGRYHQAKRAYTESVAKCEAGRQAWTQKADEKQLDKANALIEKSLAAGNKGDSKLMQIYQDSVSVLQGGPSCLVKDPSQPDQYYDLEREVDVRAERAAVKASGLGGGEFAMAQERAMAILRSGPPSDVSQSEKAAVVAKKGELQPLLWPGEKSQTAKAEPAPTPVQPPAAAAAPTPNPQTTAAANAMGACMAKNMEAHKAEIESLQKEAIAAQKAKDQNKLIAAAQRMQQIQMAGCTGR